MRNQADFSTQTPPEQHLHRPGMAIREVTPTKKPMVGIAGLITFAVACAISGLVLLVDPKDNGLWSLLGLAVGIIVMYLFALLASFIAFKASKNNHKVSTGVFTAVSGCYILLAFAGLAAGLLLRSHTADQLGRVALPQLSARQAGESSLVPASADQNPDAALSRVSAKFEQFCHDRRGAYEAMFESAAPAFAEPSTLASVDEISANIERIAQLRAANQQYAELVRALPDTYRSILAEENITGPAAEMSLAMVMPADRHQAMIRVRVMEDELLGSVEQRLKLLRDTYGAWSTGDEGLVFAYARDAQAYGDLGARLTTLGAEQQKLLDRIAQPIEPAPRVAQRPSQPVQQAPSIPEVAASIIKAAHASVDAARAKFESSDNRLANYEDFTKFKRREQFKSYLSVLKAHEDAATALAAAFSSAQPSLVKSLKNAGVEPGSAEVTGEREFPSDHTQAATAYYEAYARTTLALREEVSMLERTFGRWAAAGQLREIKFNNDTLGKSYAQLVHNRMTALASLDAQSFDTGTGNPAPTTAIVTGEEAVDSTAK